MAMKRDPAENGIRSPLAPRWAPNVMVGCTAYPSEMGNLWDKAAMAFRRDWAQARQEHAIYPGSGPSW